MSIYLLANVNWNKIQCIYTRNQTLICVEHGESTMKLLKQALGFVRLFSLFIFYCWNFAVSPVAFQSQLTRTVEHSSTHTHKHTKTQLQSCGRDKTNIFCEHIENVRIVHVHTQYTWRVFFCLVITFVLFIKEIKFTLNGKM